MRDTPSRRWTALAAGVVLVFAGAAMQSARADDEHIFCIVQDAGAETRYYSAVFLADYSWTVGIENDFHAWAG